MILSLTAVLEPTRTAFERPVSIASVRSKAVRVGATPKDENSITPSMNFTKSLLYRAENKV